MIPQGQWSTKGSGDSTAAATGDPSSSAGHDVGTPGRPGAQPPGAPATGLQSCQFCRKRKIKCDKALPKCSHCVRAQTPCIYPPSQRRGRPRIAAKHKPPSSTPREEQLLKKIKRLETVIDTLRGGGGDEGEQSDTDPVRQRLGRLVVGKPYVNDTFWTSNEIKDLLGNGDDDSDSDGDESSSLTPIVTSSHMRRHNFLFSVDMTNQDLSDIHPPPWQIPKYWQLYYQNFEIVMRFQHQPAAKKLFEEAQENKFNLTKSKEVLLFAMYFAAVTSLADEEVPGELGGEKSELLAKYEDGIKKGLQKAEFLHTQDLMVLQAFVIYLTCIRHSDGAVVWTMTGLALRIAEGLGIHRDGKLFGLPPFDVEMRRRVWHNIMILDVRASEARGCLPTFIYADTELPLRINESDLHPDMKQEPRERNGLTDMTVALIRYEMSQMGRQLQDNPFQAKPTSLQAKEKNLNDFLQRMQTRYLQYGESDKAPPLTRYAAAVVRLVTARMFLMIFQYQNGEMSQETKDRLFQISLHILELSVDVQNDPCAKKYGYLFRAHIQWHAIATLLKELAVRPRSADTDRAWRIVDKSSPDWTVANDSPDNVMSLSVKKLLTKAQAHREETYKHEAFDSTATLSEFTQYHTEAEEQPPFIAQSTFEIPAQYAYLPQGQPHQFQVPFHTTMEMQQAMPFQYVPVMPPPNQITSYIFEPPSFDEMDMTALPNMTEEPWNPWGVDMSTDYRYKGP